MEITIKKQKLFDTQEIDGYAEKFESKIRESESKIEKLRSDLEATEKEIDVLLENCILDDGKSNGELSNAKAKKVNFGEELIEETTKLSKLKEIMYKGLQDIIPATSAQFQKDLITYEETAEKVLFEKLYQLRKQQEEVLVTIQATRNAVVDELFIFNTKVERAGAEKRYTHMADLNRFHNALNIPHRTYGFTPLIDCKNITQIESVLERMRASDNAYTNSGKESKEYTSLPPVKRIADIDLQAFFKSIK